MTRKNDGERSGLLLMSILRHLSYMLSAATDPPRSNVSGRFSFYFARFYSR